MKKKKSDLNFVRYKSFLIFQNKDRFWKKLWILAKYHCKTVQSILVTQGLKLGHLFHGRNREHKLPAGVDVAHDLL